jgi:hypothetical protein
MVDAVWPSNVPHEPEQGGYGETIASNLASFSPDVGPPTTWRRSTIKSTKIQATILMTGAERDLFTTFFTDTLGDGALPFTWTNPAYGVSKRYTFDPGSPPQWASVGYDLYRVQLNIIKLSA